LTTAAAKTAIEPTLVVMSQESPESPSLRTPATLRRAGTAETELNPVTVT